MPASRASVIKLDYNGGLMGDSGGGGDGGGVHRKEGGKQATSLSEEKR